jgi:dolichyl-phosphate beta-glucosyltransferase
MNDQIKLTIVVPAYKEEKRIHLILDAVEKYVKSKDFNIETIVVVDGSPDQTAEVAKGYASRIPDLHVIDRQENKGKGASVKEGVLKARGDYIIFADADNSTPIEQADELLESITKYEVVIGSRYISGGQMATPQPLIRRLGSRFLNIIIQLFAVPGIRDTQCGFKMFQRDAAHRIFRHLKVNDFSFDIELLAIARKLGYKTKEVGVVWHDNPHSTVSPFSDGWRMIRDTIAIRKRVQNIKKI